MFTRKKAFEKDNSQYICNHTHKRFGKNLYHHQCETTWALALMMINFYRNVCEYDCKYTGLYLFIEVECENPS